MRTSSPLRVNKSISYFNVGGHSHTDRVAGVDGTRAYLCCPSPKTARQTPSSCRPSVREGAPPLSCFSHLRANGQFVAYSSWTREAAFLPRKPYGASPRANHHDDVMCNRLEDAVKPRGNAASSSQERRPRRRTVAADGSDRRNSAAQMKSQVGKAMQDQVDKSQEPNKICACVVPLHYSWTQRSV